MTDFNFPRKESEDFEYVYIEASVDINSSNTGVLCMIYCVEKVNCVFHNTNFQL